MCQSPWFTALCVVKKWSHHKNCCYQVVRDKRTGKTKGYGFVSFKDPNDYVRAMREMNGQSLYTLSPACFVTCMGLCLQVGIFYVTLLHFTLELVTSNFNWQRSGLRSSVLAFIFLHQDVNVTLTLVNNCCLCVSLLTPCLSREVCWQSSHQIEEEYVEGPQHWSGSQETEREEETRPQIMFMQVVLVVLCSPVDRQTPWEHSC